jgi:hypothetical protein
VFLSHSSKDKSIVRPLAERLKKDGLRVWFDEWIIEEGDSIFLAIEKGLEKSLVNLLIMSKNSLGSEWPDFERSTSMFRDPTNKHRRFIPLRLDDCTIPDTLKQFKYFDFRNNQDDAYKKLLSSCKPKEVASQAGKQKISLSHLPSTGKDLFGRDKEIKKLSDALNSPTTHLFSLVAWGGVGKSALVNRWLTLQKAVGFSGAKKVFAWSFYSQGTKEGGQASADQFFAAALDWFEVPKDKQPNNAHDRALRLADECEKQKTLLILDGMEPLQYAPGAMGGGLRDAGMVTLLKELAQRLDGLCLITTRWSIAELNQFEGGSFSRVDLEELSVPAGVELLKSLGVHGAAQEMEKAVDDFAGHALALTLLGEFLQVVHEGDVLKRDLIADLRVGPTQGGHARRVMDSYIKWLQEDNPAALEILKLMGLFDRPVPKGAMGVLRAEPAISGLTTEICQFDDAKWAFKVDELRKMRLLAPSTAGEHLQKAKDLVAKTGYHRRDGEVEGLQGLVF